jgi:oxygen-independent coproporphyrinogen-3 oxidase
MRHRKPENFLSAVKRNQHGLKSEERLDRSTQAVEALLMGLRLREGVDISALSDRFAIDSADLLDWQAVDKLLQLGFVHRDLWKIQVLPQGFPLLDAILPEIVAIEPAPAG